MIWQHLVPSWSQMLENCLNCSLYLHYSFWYVPVKETGNRNHLVCWGNVDTYFLFNIPLRFREKIKLGFFKIISARTLLIWLFHEETLFSCTSLFDKTEYFYLNLCSTYREKGVFRTIITYEIMTKRYTERRILLQYMWNRNKKFNCGAFLLRK